jgi:hypothetical protein
MVCIPLTMFNTCVIVKSKSTVVCICDVCHAEQGCQAHAKVWQHIVIRARLGAKNSDKLLDVTSKAKDSTELACEA